MDSEKTGTIYKIVCKKTEKLYVGQTTCTIEGRLCSHICTAFNPNKADTYLGRAIKKYGKDNFEITKIETCSEELLNEREMYWIAKLDTFNNGYNLTEGGGGRRGYSLDEGTKKKISDANKGKKLDEGTKKKISDAMKGKRTGKNNSMFGRTGKNSPFFGKKRSEETKKKISDAMKEFHRRQRVI